MVGLVVGDIVGDAVGPVVGDCVGDVVGLVVGDCVGVIDGLVVNTDEIVMVATAGPPDGKFMLDTEMTIEPLEPTIMYAAPELILATSVDTPRLE